MLVVVNKPRPFNYLATPKTGSTTMRTLIYQNWATDYDTIDRATMAWEHHGYVMLWPEHVWVTSVRNPLSRAVSLWSEYRDREIPGHATPEFRRYFELVKAADTFEAALFDPQLDELGFWTRHTAMMAFIDMCPRIDVHIRIEHLAEDIKEHLLPRIGYPPMPELPRRRVGGYRQRSQTWQDEYRPGCYEKVCADVAGDFAYCRKHRLYTETELEDPCHAA